MRETVTATWKRKQSTVLSSLESMLIYSLTFFLDYFLRRLLKYN